MEPTPSGEQRTGADDRPTGLRVADNLNPKQDGYHKMAAKSNSELMNPTNPGLSVVGLPQRLSVESYLWYSPSYGASGLALRNVLRGSYGQCRHS